MTAKECNGKRRVWVSLVKLKETTQVRKRDFGERENFVTSYFTRGSRRDEHRRQMPPWQQGQGDIVFITVMGLKN